MDPEEDNELVPAAPDRVCRRAFVLAAVACRASLEEAPQHPDAVATYARLQDWLAHQDLGEESEVAEWKAVACPLGALDERTRIDMSWRSEGLVVLAWALRRAEIPPHDKQADGPAVADTIGFLAEGATSRLISDPRLRSDHELWWLAELTLAVHWRLREYSLHPGPIDFVDYTRNCQWAKMPVESLPMIGADLAIRGKPVSETPEDLLHECASIARERQQAANWLIGQEERYSNVTCDT
jgi:hypothetical protein